MLRIILIAISLSCLNLSPFRYIFSNIIADQGVDKNTIANIYLWNSVILLFSILLMGYLFDKFGYRFIFVTSGFLILLICILVLFNNHNIYCIIASIFMYSLYKGCLRGKREAFMYNSLLKIDKINFYQRGMVMLYLFGEMAGIVGISLCNLQNDYHNIIYLQIFLCTMAILSMHYVKIDAPKKKKISLRIYLSMVLQFFKNKQNSIALISLSYYVGMIISIDEILTLMSNHGYIDKNDIMKIGGFILLSLLLGSICRLIIKRNVSHRIYTSIFIVVMSINALFTQICISLSIIGFYVLTFFMATMEGYGTMVIDKSSTNETRGITSSIMWTLSIIISIIIAILIKILIPYTTIDILIFGFYLIGSMIGISLIRSS